MKKLLFVLSVISALFLTGCAVTAVRSGDTRFFRAAIGNRTDLGRLSGEITGTNQTRRIDLQGYSNDQVDGIREGAKGAAQGLGKSFIQ